MMTVGCLSTNSVNGREVNSIARTAMMTASIMMESSFTMPTDVMIESKENMASSTTIWVMTCQNTAW